MKGLRPSTARAAEPCVLKARKAAERDEHVRAVQHEEDQAGRSSKVPH